MLGANRNGKTSHAPLTTTWEAKAKVAWQVGLGSGFGGPAVVAAEVFILHRLGNEEVLEVTDLSDGKPLWRVGWPASYRASYNPDNGPRCVPTIVDQFAICYGASGDLVCIDRAKRSIAWQRALRKEYQAEDGYFGAGASPLVVGDLIVVCLGGKQAGIVGIDLNSGATRWKATNYDASYASPIALDATTALVVTRLNTVLVDLADGKILADIAFGSRGPTVNAATPIAVDEFSYLLTASYGVGATLLSTQDRKLAPVFEKSQLLSSQYNTPVLVQAADRARRIIGIDGREDVGVGNLRSLDLDAKKVVWEQSGFGTAHLIAIGKQVLALTIDGRLTLIDGSADRYQELAAMQLPAGTYRAPPALSQGKFLARSTNVDTGRSQLICVELPLGETLAE